MDSIDPTLVVATVDGTSLKLIYSEALDTGSVPAASAYSVVVGSATGVPPSSVAVSGAKVTLTLSTGAASGDTVTVTYTKPGTNPLQYLASNDAAALSAQAVANNTGSTNNQPVFPTTPTTRSVAENTITATQFGTAVTATDADSSDTLYYTLPSGFFAFAIGSNTGQLQTYNANLDYEDTASYIVPVYVSDRKNAAGTADTAIDDTISVTINVTNVNEAPMITSGANNVTKPEQTLTSEILATYAVTDPDNGAVLTWMLGDDDAGDFTIVGGELKFRNEPNFENPADNDNNNIHTVTVNVSDGSLSATQDVTTTVTNVNEAPLLTSPPTTKSVPENSTAVHEYAATDVDANTTLSWSLSGADAPKFAISTSGVLTFRNPPDFETPTDTGDTNMDNLYVVTVRVDDNGSAMARDLHTLRVTVTDVNETPEITSGPTTISKDENTPTTEIIATYMATDPDATTGNMSWDLQGSDAGDFTIVSPVNGTAHLYFRFPPNHEVAADTGGNNVYDITVRVRDHATTRLQDTRDVDVTVNDVNETPVISGDATPNFAEIEFDATSADLTVGTYSYTDEDLNPPDTITWDLSGTDEMHFDIGSSSGALSFKQRPNFESPVDSGSNNTYVFVVEADDSEGGVGTYNVTVTVTNIDETPEITSNNATQTFAEIEYDYEHVAMDLDVATFTARDEEDGTTGIVWAVSSTDAGDFQISTGTVSGSGRLHFRSPPNFENPADADTNNVYEITLIARDTTSPHKTRDYPVTVTVTEKNERPEVSGVATTSYNEIVYNLGLNLTIPDAGTYTATDYDDGDTFTWDLDGVDADHFNIGVTSGVLTFVARPDYERPVDSDDDNTYDIIVQATDEHMYTGEFSVTIRITPINEIPEISDGPTSVTYDENAGVEVGSYIGHDEETPIHWSLTGTDRGDFNISGTGTVTFKATPDFKAQTDANTDNIYSFNVKVSDGLLSGPERGVTVTVMDLEEAGTLTVDNLSPAVGDRVKFTLTDPDGGIDLTKPPLGQPPPILWNIELSTTSTGPWVGKHVGESLAETFTYTIVEGDTDKYLRASITYIDERGAGEVCGERRDRGDNDGPHHQREAAVRRGEKLHHARRGRRQESARTDNGY